MKAVVLLALVVACAVGTNAVLKCHKCTNTACTEDLADKSPENCADGEKLCYKFGAEGSRDHGCTALADDKAFCEENAVKKTDCSTCDTDGCNSSSSVLASAALVAVSAALLKMYN